MNQTEIQTELTRLRNLPEVQNWTTGDPYPDLDLPDGYGFTYNCLSGNLCILRESTIGQPHLDPRFERYHCM